MAAVLAVVGLASSVALAVRLVVGHHPLEGPVIVAFAEHRGIHLGDLLALGPAVAGLVLLGRVRTRPVAPVAGPSPSRPR